MQIALQECMGTKRANYMMLTGKAIDAKTALDWGIVNEVLPREKLYPRAMEIAEYMMQLSRKTRRITIQVLRRPWKKRIAEELRDAFGTEMWVTSTEHAEHVPEAFDQFQSMIRKQFEDTDVKIADVLQAVIPNNNRTTLKRRYPQLTVPLFRTYFGRIQYLHLLMPQSILYIMLDPFATNVTCMEELS